MFLVILLLQVATARNTFVSSPFDNFRMECSKRAAAVDVSIKIVESVGAKRQDVVFDMSCEEVQELFPWINIPAGVAEIDREDCYYSATFDPLLDENTEYSCKRREYMAGIARLTGTRLQILCCRLRSRDEFNCSEVSFNKPIGHTKSTIIEYDNKLINAIRIDDKIYVVRFCDLAPRDIANIYGDTKKTLARQHVTTLKPYAKARDKGNSSLIESRATTLRHSTSLFGTASLKPVSLQISSSQSIIQHMVPLSETSNSAAKPEALKDQVSARIRSAKTGTVGKMHHEKTLTTTSNIFSTIRYPINQVETVRQITRFRQSETPRTSSNLNDLSKITFYDNDFPNSNERKFAIPAKMKISKADLPLKTATPDDFMFLQTSSSDGRHRTPIQTHRPHVVSISILRD
uniref:Protein spaetzle n=1 Tax=Haemonchus contortus TaxID=6289 RepID=A0A7I4Z297_HAECO